MSRSRLRRPSLLIALGALAAALSLTVASPASAHDELIGSDPAAEATIDALPGELTLTFSAVVLDEPGATEVVVTDAAGASVTMGDPVLDGTRVRQPLDGDAQGRITVLWRVVSSDGHPISGEYSFIVGSEDAGPSAAPSEAPVGGDGDGGPGAGLWIGVGVAVVVVGAIVVLAVTAASRRRRED